MTFKSGKRSARQNIIFNYSSVSESSSTTSGAGSGAGSGSLTPCHASTCACVNFCPFRSSHVTGWCHPLVDGTASLHHAGAFIILSLLLYRVYNSLIAV